MRGELLVQLDTTLARAEIARAEATLAGARTTLKLAENELARRAALHRPIPERETGIEPATLGL